ncbi:TPA: N-acetylmuramoyl-L-alanine amidase [Bacillus wiedmannii]|nr:N-acetylmuramoyl-L-alanine amidase [Bacillus wiedmannii]
MFDLYTFGAGHSFKVRGASGNGYREEVETRRVVKRLLEICYQHGIRAVDTTDNDGNTQRENLNNIVRNCNSYPKNGRLDVAIHFNQAESESGGVEVWYYDQVSLAAKVSKEVAAALGLRDRGAKEGKGLAVLNGTNAPAILIELPFLSHQGNMQAYEDNFDNMCRAIVQVVTGREITVNGNVTNDVHVTGSQGIVTVKVDVALVRREPTTQSGVNNLAGNNGRISRGSEWQSWGSTIGEGGYTWYPLGNEMWVRGDLVSWRNA